MIKVNGATISLDRRESEADMDFISHAHTDHIYAAKKSECVIASTETIALMKAAYGIEAKALRQGHRTDVDTRLLNSGHMMGANINGRRADSVHWGFSDAEVARCG